MRSARFPIGIRFSALFPALPRAFSLFFMWIRGSAAQLCSPQSLTHEPSKRCGNGRQVWCREMESAKAGRKQRSGGSRKQTARTQERRAGAGSPTLCFCLAFTGDMRRHSRQKTLSWKNRRMGNISTGAMGRAFRAYDRQDTFININTNEENLALVSLTDISATDCAQTIIASRCLRVVMSFAQSALSLRFCSQQWIPNSSPMAYDGREQTRANAEADLECRRAHSGPLTQGTL